MLRWYFASLVFLLVVSPGIGFGVYRYVMTHPAEPATLAGRVYERTVKKKLLAHCGEAVEPYGRSDMNTQAQLDAACQCFTNAMFEKFRDVPPGALDATAEQEDTKRAAVTIFKTCASQSGLNQ
jgi:hypothetical protein